MTVPSSSTSIENKGAKRIQPKTECEKDVLLLRQNSDPPQLKEGNRYRVRAGGSAHANSGEGQRLVGRELQDMKSTEAQIVLPAWGVYRIQP